MSTIRWGGLVILVTGIVLVIIAAAMVPATVTGPNGTAYIGERGTSAANAWLWVLGVIGVIVGGLMLIFGRGRRLERLERPLDQLRPPTTPGQGPTL